MPIRPEHGGDQQVCVDLMLWSGQGRNREFYDAATMGAVARVTGGRVTYLRDGDAGGAETALHLREQLKGSLRDHADSASETVLKVSQCPDSSMAMVWCAVATCKRCGWLAVPSGWSS